jgi:hypothetical protein
MNGGEGGSGMFRIETRRRMNNLVDYNHNFGTIGIVGPP